MTGDRLDTMVSLIRLAVRSKTPAYREEAEKQGIELARTAWREAEFFLARVEASCCEAEKRAASGGREERHG